MSLIGDVEGLLRELRFARTVRNALTGVRLVHETDEQTFERILRLAGERVCERCRGYGYVGMTRRVTCSACAGVGARDLEPIEDT